MLGGGAVTFCQKHNAQHKFTNKKETYSTAKSLNVKIKHVCLVSLIIGLWIITSLATDVD